MRLRIQRFLPVTEAEGPGRRACVWVQGCSIRCQGCFNPHTWDPLGGSEVDVADLVARLGRVQDIEGITLLGGEPFDQAEAVAELAAGAQRLGLSVMTFTGHELERLATGEQPGWSRLLAATDLLVDGPFVEALRDDRRPWVGSTNQRFHFLTPRYRHLADSLEALPDRVEIRLYRDGTVWLNGQCSPATLGGLKRLIRGHEADPGQRGRRPSGAQVRGQPGPTPVSEAAGRAQVRGQPGPTPVSEAAGRAQVRGSI